MASVTEYLERLQKLTQTNLDLLKALNDSFYTKNSHLVINVDSNKFVIPSFIQLENKINMKEFIEEVSKQPQLVYCYDFIPTSTLSCKNDNVYLGRVRIIDNNILLYCVADNIRVGAATNAYLILKHMIKLGEENG